MTALSFSKKIAITAAAAASVAAPLALMSAGTAAAKEYTFGDRTVVLNEWRGPIDMGSADGTVRATGTAVTRGVGESGTNLLRPSFVAVVGTCAEPFEKGNDTAAGSLPFARSAACA